MSSKNDLEKLIKTLKIEIRTLKKSSKVFDEDIKDLTNFGFGIKLEDNVWHLAELKFNNDGSRAAVTNILKLDKSVVKAVTLSQRAIGKHITDLNRGR